jgi:hypothetical protein
MTPTCSGKFMRYEYTGEKRLGKVKFSLLEIDEKEN